MNQNTGWTILGGAALLFLGFLTVKLSDCYTQQGIRDAVLAKQCIAAGGYWQDGWRACIQPRPTEQR
jgi:hypothetical protein